MDVAAWWQPTSEGTAMIAAFSVTPVGTGESVGDLVADCVQIVRDSGLDYEANAMFTNVEGEWDDVQAVVGRCIDHVAEHAPRVSVVMKVDHRPAAGGGQLASKRQRVE